MSPEQMQQMMQAMPNITPDMMQQAMSQMNNMRPDDWEKIRNQVANADPAQLARDAAQMNTHVKAQQDYTLRASIGLKEEGNRLVAAKSYADAAAKYQKAKENVASFTSNEGRDLWKACTLNLGVCYLNLQRYKECVQACDEAIAVDATNIKALYRRGQAQLALKNWSQAVADLQISLNLAKRP